MDLSSLCRHLVIAPLAFVTHLREEVQELTGCSCSVGLGPSPLLARLALRQAKPQGQAFLGEEEAGVVLETLGVGELPGVGRTMVARLQALGVTTVGQLGQVALGKLQATFGGKTGQQLHRMARGRDDRKLEVEQVRKTVSAEVNYGIRFKSWEEAETFLGQLAGEVADRLEKVGRAGRSVTLKLMKRAAGAAVETSKYNGHGVCDSLSRCVFRVNFGHIEPCYARSAQLLTSTRDCATILREVVALAKGLAVEPAEWRGVGISVTRLEEEGAGKGGGSILKFVTKGKKEDTSISEDSSIIEVDQEEVNTTESVEIVDARDQPMPSTSEGPDPEFLAALPPSLRLEVESQWRAPKPSPLAFKEDTPLPSTSRSNESSTYKAAAPTNSTPAPLTDLDLEFLAQLPEDIRAELEAEHGRKRREQKKEEVLKDDKMAKMQEIEDVANASFSQVDPRVLAELPEEVQQEVRQHYVRSKEVKEANKSLTVVKTKTAFDKLMRFVPKKATSPLKAAKGKRGRPKGSTNDKSKRLHKSPKSGPNKSNLPEGVDMEVFNSLPEELRKEVEGQLRPRALVSTSRKILFENSNSKTPIFEDSRSKPIGVEVENSQSSAPSLLGEKSKSVEPQGPPQFCGQSGVSGLRPLLKSWLSSTSSPLQEDIAMLGDFLKDLVIAWRLDMVSVLLKILHRFHQSLSFVPCLASYYLLVLLLKLLPQEHSPPAIRGSLA